MKLFKFIKKKWKARLAQSLPQVPQIARPVLLLGGHADSAFGAWAMDPSQITAKSIIYSVGVGDDISFDLALIERFGAKVYAFDPTLEAQRWLKRRDIQPLFQFIPFGVADYDGVAQFFPHKNVNWVSHSMVKGWQTSSSLVTLPVKRLTTMMNDFGHTKIDLLKLDIEGEEYNVIRDFLNSAVCIKQLLVEFHHRFERFSVGMTKESIALLNAAGFKIFFISPSKDEYSFIQTGAAKS